MVLQVQKCSAGIEQALYLATAAELIFWIMLVNFACSQYHSLAVDMVMLQVN